jgi:hypothetical protein
MAREWDVSEANEYEIHAATRDLQPPRRLPSVLATAFAFSSAVFRSNVSEYWLGRRREADFEAAQCGTVLCLMMRMLPPIRKPEYSNRFAIILGWRYVAADKPRQIRPRKVHRRRDRDYQPTSRGWPRPGSLPSRPHLDCSNLLFRRPRYGRTRPCHGIGLNKSIALRRIEPLHRISKDWQNLNHVGTCRRFRPLEHLGSADVDHAAEQRMYLFEKSEAPE